MQRMAELVVLASDNGRDGWTPVKPDAVPAWVKEPNNLGRLVNGEECMKADEGDKGSMWYRALTAEDYQRIVAAQEKRARRKTKRLH